MLEFRSSSGNIIYLTELIGEGGEGWIYAVRNSPDLVAKIYHPDKIKQQEAKLSVMLANPPIADLQKTPNNELSIAWPLDLLYKPGKIFSGYLMPKITGCPDIFQIYNPKIRKEKYPYFNWRYLHRTGRNLSLVLNALHRRGYVIGDINQKNILVRGNAQIVLIDTDSFQVQQPGTRTTFRCVVGVPDYTPPELLNVSLDSINRIPQHDCFGLAVILFQMLMEGYHPFTGISRNSAISMGGDIRNYCLKNRIFPFQNTGGFRPPLSAPELSILHPEVKDLFENCFYHNLFNPEKRPTAEDWTRVLSKAEENLVRCKNNSEHWYSRHLSRCPWCEQVKKITSFPVQNGLPNVFQSNSAAPPARTVPRKTAVNQINLSGWTKTFTKLLQTNFNPRSAILFFSLAFIVMCVFFFSLANRTNENPPVFSSIPDQPTSTEILDTETAMPEPAHEQPTEELKTETPFFTETAEQSSGVDIDLNLIPSNGVCEPLDGPIFENTNLIKFAFTGNIKKGTHVFLANSDGSELTDLSDNQKSFLGNLFSAEIIEVVSGFSADGSSLLIVSKQSDDPGVYVIDLNVPCKQKINAEGQSIFGGASWSPDGQQVAYLGSADAVEYDIYLVARDGSNPVNLTSQFPVRPGAPVWSPDGQKLLFSGVDLTSNDEEIFLIDINGDYLVNLTQNPEPDRNPQWSPDGNLIYFESYRTVEGMSDFSPSDIFVMNSDGSNQRLLFHTVGYDSEFKLSPDGTKILLVEEAPLQIGGNYVEIYSIMDGSISFCVISSENNPAYHSSPVWSPDGKRVYVYEERKYFQGIYSCDRGTTFSMVDTGDIFNYVDNISRRP